MVKLAQKKCVPCEGWMKPLDVSKVRKLVKEVPGWKTFSNKNIEKEIKFKNFKDAVRFINKVAKIAEEEHHHPDFLLHGYNKVKFTLSTHAIGGLSENDFIMAAKINKLL